MADDEFIIDEDFSGIKLIFDKKQGDFSLDFPFNISLQKGQGCCNEWLGPPTFWASFDKIKELHEILGNYIKEREDG